MLIEKLEAQLEELINETDDPYITVEDAAKIIGTDAAVLRRMIYKGKCPFAIGYAGDSHHNGYAKILKLPLYRWLTKS